MTAVLLSDVTGEPAAAACSKKLRVSANFWQNWMEFMEALASSWTRFLLGLRLLKKVLVKKSLMLHAYEKVLGCKSACVANMKHRLKQMQYRFEVIYETPRTSLSFFLFYFSFNSNENLVNFGLVKALSNMKIQFF